MGTFFYMLLAFVVGLVLGWFLWGRLRGELDGLRASYDSTRSERDRLRADTTRLNGELEACAKARADLDRQLGDARAARSSSALPPAASPPPAAKPAAPADAGYVPKPETPAPASGSAAAAASVPAGAAGFAGSAGPRAAGSSGKDDLRRLIGIGPANERHLNEHGVTTFAQIAAWTADDIRTVEGYLQFDGRIERERWVDQARLLAAGDEEEFARRYPKAGTSDNS